MIRDTYNMQTELVASEDMKHTYSVIRRIDNGESNDSYNRILVVELYPTLSLDRVNELDLSTLHLMNHIRELGDFSEIEIVNLFSFVCTNGKPTAASLKADDIENQAYLEDVLDDTKDSNTTIVIGWGSTWESNETVQNLKRQFLVWLQEKELQDNTYHIVNPYLLDEGKYSACVHPLYMGLRFSKEKWCLEKLDIAYELKQLQPKEKVTEKKEQKKTGRGRKKDVSKNNGQTGRTDGSKASKTAK